MITKLQSRISDAYDNNVRIGGWDNGGSTLLIILANEICACFSEYFQIATF